MKLLWGSPLPPVRSGVSDYAVELLGELGSRAEVRVLEPPGWCRPEDWHLDGAVELVATGTAPMADEIPIIHLGNNRQHLWLLDRLGLPRTVVVLHDLVLHHLLVEAAAAKQDHGLLEQGLCSAHGAAGEALAKARSLGMTHPRDPFLFPARGAFLDGVTAVMVHSHWAEATIRRERPQLAVGRVGLAVADPGTVDRGRERARLGLGESEVVLMHLGFLTAEKGLSEVLTGLAAAVRAGVPARLVLVGEGVGLEGVVAAAEAVGIGEVVTATGWLAPEVFPRVPAAADLGVVLRTPSAGETSAAAIRFLACGTPVAVGGAHQFLQWPEAAAPRITPGPSAPAELARLLAETAAAGENWTRRRLAARASYEANHRPADVAAQIIEFLEFLEEKGRRAVEAI